MFSFCNQEVLVHPHPQTMAQLNNLVTPTITEINYGNQASTIPYPDLHGMTTQTTIQVAHIKIFILHTLFINDSSFSQSFPWSNICSVSTPVSMSLCQKGGGGVKKLFVRGRQSTTGFKFQISGILFVLKLVFTPSMNFFQLQPISRFFFSWEI